MYVYVILVGTTRGVDSKQSSVPGSSGFLQKILRLLDVFGALVEDALHVTQVAHALPDLLRQVLQQGRGGGHLHGQHLVGHLLDALQVGRVL